MGGLQAGMSIATFGLILIHGLVNVVISMASAVIGISISFGEIETSGQSCFISGESVPYYY